MASEKVCVVIGAGPGVGLAVARKFGSEGFAVALVGRNAATLEEYVNTFSKDGLKAQAFAADSGDFKAVRETFGKIKAALGEPDVLVYNAAVIRQGGPLELSPETLLADFGVNAVGALVAAQEVIPAMQQKQAGTLLFTGGGLSLYPSPQYLSLSLGKAGIRSLALALAADLEPHNIQVATVTIAGTVQPGTHFDPDLIAQRYWDLHSQPAGSREHEIIFK